MSAVAQPECAQPRLLVVSHVKDERGGNGGAVYTAGLIDLLKREFAEVRVEYIYSGTPRWRRLRIAAAFLRSVFSGLAAKVEYFRVGEARNRIGEAVAKFAPDLVIFDHLETVLYAAMLGGNMKKLLIQHNDEALLYAQRVAHIRPGWLRALLGVELKRLARFQNRAYELCGNAVFLSADEASQASVVPLCKSFTLMPSFSYSPVASIPSTDARTHLFFVGTMDWWPNADAIDWFVAEVFRATPPELVLHLVGRGSERWHGRHPRVVAHGFVEDRAKVWGVAPIFIAPVRLGAGVNIKVAEAIYNGRALLATPQALRGLRLTEDSAIVSLASAEEWIACLSDRQRLAVLLRTEPVTANRKLFERDCAQKQLGEYLKSL